MSRAKRRRSAELLRPRTKPTVSPYRLPSGEILLARDVYGLGLSLRDDGAGTVWRLLSLMDGRRNARALLKELRSTHPKVSEASFGAAIERLRQLGVIEEGAPLRPAGWSPEEVERYSRNLEFFSLLTLGSGRPPHELQERLRRARVTLLGVGAVGGATATSLVAAGVGHLTVIDFDRVERSNLNRQVLFGSSDLGRAKVEAARDRLGDLNPHVEVQARSLRVTRPAQLLPLLRGCDLFILGADQPHEILQWTNDAAIATGTPWLENSYAGPRCAIALFVPGRTPCLRCLQHHLETRLHRAGTATGTGLFPPTAGNPVVAPTAGIAGHYGALEALYFLSGLKPPSEGRLLQLNLWRPQDLRVEHPTFWKECPSCGSRAAGRGGRRGGAARRRPQSRETLREVR